MGSATLVVKPAKKELNVYEITLSPHKSFLKIYYCRQQQLIGNNLSKSLLTNA